MSNPTGNFPVIRRSNPYTSQNFRASRPVTPSAPFAGQDLNSALLQQQQFVKSSIPSTQYQDTYNYDPILQKIQALGAQSVANAKTNAGALRSQAAITEGDPELLKSLGFDANTITAAQNNPESLYAALNNDYQKRYKDLAETESANNLYYSGEYQKNLAEMARGQASGQGALGQHFRDLLSGIDSGVLDATEADRKAQEQAALDAAQQAFYNTQYQSLLDQLNAIKNGTSSTPAPEITPATPGAVTTTNSQGNVVLDPVANASPGDIPFEGGTSNKMIDLSQPAPVSAATPSLLGAIANPGSALADGVISAPVSSPMDLFMTPPPSLAPAAVPPAYVPQAILPPIDTAPQLSPDTNLLAALANPTKTRTRAVFA